MGGGRASLDPIKGEGEKEQCRKDDESFIQQTFRVSTWHKHRNIRGTR